MPPSHATALVLGQVSRYLMLESRYEEAVRFGAEALEMASELGLDELRADALGSIAAAHTGLGDIGSIAELEESIEILERRGSVQALRGYNNLLHSLFEFGELERAQVISQRAAANAERFGYVDWLRWIGEKRGQLAYMTGRWDELMPVADREIASMEAGAPHYLEPSYLSMRCLIRLASGDRDAAREDSVRALELARPVGDPQALLPILALRAHVCLELGEPESAGLLLDELIGAMRERMGLRSFYWWHFAVAALELGLTEQFLAVAATAPGTPWVEAGRAVVEGDFARAAAVYGRIGARSQEAAARLRAAEQQFDAGAQAAGEAELELALVFWRSVGASGYLGDAETLAAAS